MSKEELNTCKNNCSLDGTNCIRKCMTDTTCKDDCIKNNPTNSCFDSCTKNNCIDECTKKNTDCTDSCINLHGSEKDKSERRFIKAETKTINNVHIVKRPEDANDPNYEYDNHGKCGDVEGKRFVCDNGMYCNEDGSCQDGVPPDYTYYEKKFRMCKDLMDSHCFESVDSRGLFVKEDKGNDGNYLTDRQLNVHLVKPSEDDIKKYLVYQEELKNRPTDEDKLEKIKYGECGVVKSDRNICDKESYCQRFVDAEDNVTNECVMGKIPKNREPEINFKDINLRLCNVVAEEEQKDKLCYEKVQARGVFRMDSKFDELFSDSKILDKDLLTNDNKRCEFAKMYKHTTTSDKDEKCGNYTVKADVYNETGDVISNEVEVAKICKPGLYCAKDQKMEGKDELVNLCKKLDNNNNNFGKHRICRDEKDTFCIFKQGPNSDDSYGFKYGCYKKDKDNGDCDKVLKHVIEVEDRRKCGIVKSNLKSAALIKEQNKELEKELLEKANKEALKIKGEQEAELKLVAEKLRKENEIKEKIDTTKFNLKLEQEKTQEEAIRNFSRNIIRSFDDGLDATDREIFDKVDNIYADGKISIGSIYQPNKIATAMIKIAENNDNLADIKDALNYYVNNKKHESEAEKDMAIYLKSIGNEIDIQKLKNDIITTTNKVAISDITTDVKVATTTDAKVAAITDTKVDTSDTTTNKVTASDTTADTKIATSDTTTNKAATSDTTTTDTKAATNDTTTTDIKVATGDTTTTETKVITADTSIVTTDETIDANIVTQTGGEELVTLGEEIIEIAMICKKGSECSDDNICVPIDGELKNKDDIMRMCRNDNDVNCIVELSTEDGDYKKACVRTTLTTSKKEIAEKLAEQEEKRVAAQKLLEEEKKQTEEFKKYIPEKCNGVDADELDECNITFKAVSDRTDYIADKTDISTMKISDYDSEWFKTEKKCGVHYDVIGPDKTRYIVACGEGDMCNTDNKCVKIENDTGNNFFRMCRNGEDKNCLTTKFSDNAADDLILSSMLKTEFKIINTKDKGYKILNTLNAKPFTEDIHKKSPEELEKSFVKCSKNVTYDNAEVVDDEQQCGYFSIFHGVDGKKDIAKLCKSGSYCNTDGMCKQIKDDTKLEGNVFRVCRDSKDTNCAKKMHNSGYLHYSRVCIN